MAPLGGNIERAKGESTTIIIKIDNQTSCQGSIVYDNSIVLSLERREREEKEMQGQGLGCDHTICVLSNQSLLVLTTALFGIFVVSEIAGGLYGTSSFLSRHYPLLISSLP